jgi:hypothetical protein
MEEETSIADIMDEDYGKDFPIWKKIRNFLYQRYYSIKCIFEDILRVFERLTHNGIAKYDLWSLDYTMAKWMLPRLKAFIASDRHGCPGYFSEYSDAYGSLEKYEELVKQGRFDKEVADGIIDGPHKWEQVLQEMLFALDWIVNCDFETDNAKSRAFYKRWGYKDPHAKLESNADITYYYDMTPEYLAEQNAKSGLQAFGGLHKTIMSSDPDLHIKNPDKYIFNRMRKFYYDVKLSVKIGERAQRGAELLGQHFFSLWD